MCCCVICGRIWSTVWAACRCCSLYWSSWPWWPLISTTPAILQLHQISSPRMWLHQLMETGSFSHPTELLVCISLFLPSADWCNWDTVLVQWAACGNKCSFVVFFFQRLAWRRIWLPPSSWCWNISCRDTKSTRRTCSTRTASVHWGRCFRRSV